MKIINLENLPLQSVSHNREINKKVILSMGDLPHLTNFSQAYFAPGQVATAHSHQDMCEVFLVTGGEGKMQGKRSGITSCSRCLCGSRNGRDSRNYQYRFARINFDLL